MFIHFPSCISPSIFRSDNEIHSARFPIFQPDSAAPKRIEKQRIISDLIFMQRHTYQSHVTMSMSDRPSILDDVVTSITAPGTNRGLIIAMNTSFGALFIVLGGMVWLTGGNKHVLVLLGLSMASLGSMTWCVVSCALKIFMKADVLCRVAMEGSWRQSHLKKRGGDWRVWL